MRCTQVYGLLIFVINTNSIFETVAFVGKLFLWYLLLHLSWWLLYVVRVRLILVGFFFRFAGMSWYGLVGIYLIPISYYLSICNIWNFGRYDCLVLLHILDIIVSDLWVLMINMGCYSVLYLWDRCISFFWCILISLSVSFSLHHPYSRFRSPHHSPSCWSYRLKSEELLLTSISSSLMVFFFGNG